MNDSQKWLILGGTIFLGWLLYLLSPILMPFVISALLAYLGDPLVDRLERCRCGRTLSVCIIFGSISLFGLVLLLFILPQLEQQITALISRLPQFIHWIREHILPRLPKIAGMDPGTAHLDTVKNILVDNIQDISGIAGGLLMKLGQSAQSVLIWFSYLAVIPVATFYLLRDWDIIIERIHDLLPRSYQEPISTLARRCDEILAEFMRGQLLVMLMQAVFYTMGLWMIGLEFSLLIGSLVGLVSFVPYLGFIIGIGVSVIAGFMQFHDIIHLVYIVIVFGIGQTIEGMFLSPLLVGDRIGLHPVAVIFAVMAGGQLFGLIGVLIALPVAAMTMVVFQHARYLESHQNT